MNITAIGRTEYLYDTITKLVENGHNVPLIITAKERPEYKRTEQNFLELGKKINAEVIITKNINTPEIIEKIKKTNSEIAVSVNWINIIRNKIINLFDYGLLNAHIGNLPKYRGNAVANWAILNGEKEVVLTIHKMVEDLDAGPIILQKKFELDKTSTITDVYAFMEKEIPGMFLDSVNGLKSGEITSKEQITSGALRCYPRKPMDSMINWNTTAEEIDKLIKATAKPLPGAYTYFKGKKFVVWKVRIEKPDSEFNAIPGQVVGINSESKEVSIAAKDAFVILEKIEYKGENDPTKVLKSMRDRLGMNVEEEIEKINKRLDELTS